MLVLGKRKLPGLAAARRADPQEAGFADKTGTLSLFGAVVSLTPRDNRDSGRRPDPPSGRRSLHALLRKIADALIHEDHTLSATESGDRITVKCGCGCYSLAARKPAEAGDSMVRCLICGARARLADLMADSQAHRDRNAATKPS